MDKLVLIDGNSILNRAFYGIMGNKMLMTQDGTYTNAVYGFLSIMFKILEDIDPKYLVVAFDLKAPTKRHKMYEEYKANRKGMPDELRVQMPIIKEVLQAMNIDIIEMEGYEADDILGTLSIIGETNGLEVTILSGDRDTFQLATDHVVIRIPRTKMGKTEVDNFDKTKVIETYGLTPNQLIDVKGLQGDASDNIPGVPGVGEKTALKLISEYGSIENLYQKLESDETDLKGKLKENLVNNKELAFLSKELGTIDLNVPITDELQQMQVEEWNKEEVLEIFKRLRFNKYIERFHLRDQDGKETQERNKEDVFLIKEVDSLQEIMLKIKDTKQLYYYLGTKQEEETRKIIHKKIVSISIYDFEEKIVYYKYFHDEKEVEEQLKEMFEEKSIKKYGYGLSQDYILLNQIGIKMKNIVYDAKIAVYLLNPTKTKYSIEDLGIQYLNLDTVEYIEELGIKEEQDTQINLFDVSKNEGNHKQNEYEKQLFSIYTYIISNSYDKIKEELETINATKLFEEIEMPIVEVLTNMQIEGIYVDKKELIEFGEELKEKLGLLTKEVYEYAGEEFNINSTKQLGEILFEKLELPTIKKTKSGYSTDVEVLEKLVEKHPIIEKLLEYRQLMKLNSTYVEGLIPYINEKDEKIHSYFHQTVTATGRISSTDPNLQNIPTRIELGKRLRKVFKAGEKNVFIDADYSQIELRVLAHIANDENMIQAFSQNEDIHKQAASKVFNIEMDKVTKEERSKAKAVNFGIVYGISDFGLSEQLGVPRKVAKEYIEQYLEKYNGIKTFMEEIVEETKEKGYVETLFHRRRNVPELKSSNYNIRQFGQRVAMNTPIQGTAADIMKIAMIKVYQELKEKNMKAKLILQVHDELLIESPLSEKEEVKEMLKRCMESAITLKVPLIADLSEATNWYETK